MLGWAKKFKGRQTPKIRMILNFAYSTLTPGDASVYRHLLQAKMRILSLYLVLELLWSATTLQVNRQVSTLCPRTHDPIYKVTYYMKCFQTSWTDSNNSVIKHFGTFLRKNAN